jgi:hypothetical protein
MSVIDSDKYVKFSYYQDYSEYRNHPEFKDKLICKPTYVKGKISHLMCSPQGLMFFMDRVWIGSSKGNKKYWKNAHCRFFAKNIRWETFPFDWDKIDEKCMELVKRLPESTSGRVLIPIPESTKH